MKHSTQDRLIPFFIYLRIPKFQCECIVFVGALVYEGNFRLRLADMLKSTQNTSIQYKPPSLGGGRGKNV